MNISERTLDFALRIIRLCSSLPSNRTELEETLYWLEIVEGSELKKSEVLAPLKAEANELIAIFVSLIKRWKPR